MSKMKKKNVSRNHITKDKVIYMCKKLKELKNKTPEQILEMTNQNGIVPVDLDHILDVLGIIKIPHTFEDLECSELYKKKGEISGLVLTNKNDIGIFYKSTDSLHRKRFTIAHELGHCCMHGEMLQNGYVEFRSSISSDNEREISANNFAGELLIPHSQLLKIYNQLNVPSLKGLADIFEVSINVMRARLQHLGISFYDDSRGESD